MPPAKTGRETISKKTVTIIDHKKILIRLSITLLSRILLIEVRKFKDPIRELPPAIWSPTIAPSTLHPGCPNKPLRGG